MYFICLFLQVRLLTAHIYSLFNDLKELPSISETERWNIFNICYNVEATHAQVDTYRDILNNLEKLNFEKQQMTICKNTEFKLIPLRFFCGILYQNFQLLWDPVLNVISSHAHGLDISEFWPIFVAELKGCVSRIRNPPEKLDVVISTNCSFLKEVYETTYTLNDKPDFVNYRLLLWKGMLLFSDVAEARNRDVSELFLTFIE